MIAAPRESTAAECARLLDNEVEELVVEAKKLGMSLEDVTRSVVAHWHRLDSRDRSSNQEYESDDDFSHPHRWPDAPLPQPTGARRPRPRCARRQHLRAGRPERRRKTTAIKILMNLQRASAGTACVLDCESARLGPAQFARIGYVSENQKLPDWMTVEYFMNYLRPFYPTWDDRLAAELIRQFDLPRGRKLRHLSHGMRMKAAMASALAFRPELMVLDEPFTGLDPLVRDELIEGLLPRAEDTTIFISSHDLTEIESFASHIGYLDNGRLPSSPRR